jgi:predicted helicase
MVPITNPFLRDMLSTFLTVGGRKGRIDFDELGINEVVQALRDADMQAVLRDFGDKSPEEDPVIHFYELFLKEYDPVKRVKRGVFFTPRPVVSFIVRSVDDILRNEFGLEDGLADTTTWSEMAKRHKELEIPKGVKRDEPFVRILDPACGTGTFLVEVIDVIYRTMKAKWRRERHMELELESLWNEYVSERLLPRLYGFELMMAPYAIAHMKIGLKLHETGYNFRSHERARIYLTNSLEEPKDFSDRFEFDAPALAHEAHAVNAVKRHTRFSVVIGNPPYSGISANRGEWITHLVDEYRKIDSEALAEKKIWVKNDYVKFVRFAEWSLEHSASGILGFITDHSYLDSPPFGE